MRGFFLRLFGWFWLANMLLTFGVGIAISLSRAPFDKMREQDEAILQEVTHNILTAYDREGVAGLERRQAFYRDADNIDVWVYKDGDQPLAGPPPPPDMLILLPMVRQSGLAKTGPSTDKPGRWYVIPEPGGFVVAAHMPVPSVTRRLLNSDVLRIQLFFALLVAGFVSFVLARYLSAPIRGLREATQRVARGELHTRVEESVKKGFGELSALASDFDTMAARIEGLLNGQKRLLRDISHELRSPLARLNVALELARQRAGAEAERPLDRIELEAERLNELIGELLTLASLETGETTLKLKDIDLSQLLVDVVADADFEARSRGCSVQLEGPGTLFLQGVRELLRRAVENVVRNAIRYSQPGGVVTVAFKVEHSAVSGEAEVVIDVADSGPGVPAEHLESIFEPFYRVVAARDRESGGIGLGLAITSRAVRLHRGSVVAKNLNPSGLLVEIRLPIIPPLQSDAVHSAVA